jgi:LPXTG-site transpeptidase (sortase) family protein
MTTKWARALEIISWAVGLILLLFYLGARADGELERRQAIAAFAHARTAKTAEAPVPQDKTQYVERLSRKGREQLWANSAPDKAHWSESRIRAYEGRASARAASQPLPVALLRIPRLQLEVPVFVGTSERNLNRGAGLIAGTAAPGSNGNVAIAAHRDGYFRELKNIARGDLVELETLTGQRRYRVVHLAIVEPTDLGPLRPTTVPAVTLVTCYPFYFVGSAPRRYIVRATAVP